MKAKDEATGSLLQGCSRSSARFSRRRADALFALGFLLIAALYLYKLPFEIQGNDEAFYLTIPKRLLDGDALIVDEWHGSQLSALLLYPLMRLDRALFPSAGIVLRFRYAYLLVHAAVCLLVYARLRKEWKGAGAGAALLLFLFTPYDITALSYNTMGIDLVALTGVLLMTTRGWRSCAAAGVSFAAAVLCCPFLLAEYALFSAGIVCVGLWKRNRRLLGQWSAFTLGAACVAAVFFGFVLSRASVTALLRALPNLLSDPEHRTRGLLEWLNGYLRCILRAFLYGKYLLGVYAGMLAVIVADRKRKRHQTVYLLLTAALMAVMYAELAPKRLYQTYNAILFPPVLLGPVCYFMAESKPHRCFRYLFLGALGYGMCICYGSNQWFYIVSATCVIASMASILLLANVLWESARDGKARWQLALRRALAIGLAATQLVLMTDVKLHHFFWSAASYAELNTAIADGPYQGIRVTAQDEQAYGRQLEALRPMRAREGSVLYLTDTCWYYLATPNLSVGAYSAWLSGVNENTVQRLAEYYAQRPEKTPRYVYVPKLEQAPAELEDLLLKPYGFQEMDAPGEGKWYACCENAQP